jgi:hypothetical protein
LREFALYSDGRLFYREALASRFLGDTEGMKGLGGANEFSLSAFSELSLYSGGGLKGLCFGPDDSMDVT